MSSFSYLSIACSDSFNMIWDPFCFEINDEKKSDSILQLFFFFPPEFTHQILQHLIKIQGNLKTQCHSNSSFLSGLHFASILHTYWYPYILLLKWMQSVWFLSIAICLQTSHLFPVSKLKVALKLKKKLHLKCW